MPTPPKKKKRNPPPPPPPFPWGMFESPAVIIGSPRLVNGQKTGKIGIALVQWKEKKGTDGTITLFLPFANPKSDRRS